MNIIRFFANFCSSQEAMEAFLRSDDLEHSPQYNVTYRFTSGEDYTHAILINNPTPDLSHLPPTHVIGLAAEPSAFLGKDPEWIRYLQRTVSAYYIGDTTDLPTPPFVQRYSGMPWHCPFPSTPTTRENLMSIVVSWKHFAPGHQYRHELVCAILNDPSLPIHVYGNGCEEYKVRGDPRIKGAFDGNEPYQTYRFHVCIENFSLPEYFSEKISNALLYGCTPVYQGCKNIDRYFPESVIGLTGKVKEDIALLRQICQNPDAYEKPVDREAVRHTVSIERILDQLLSAPLIATNDSDDSS